MISATQVFHALDIYLEINSRLYKLIIHAGKRTGRRILILIFLNKRYIEAWYIKITIKSAVESYSV